MLLDIYGPLDSFKHSKWFEPRSFSSSYCLIVRARVVLKRTVVGDWRLTTWAEVIFRVKWIVFVSRWCYKVGPLNVIGQFSHDGIGWKTRVKFVISHWWVSIRLLLVLLLVKSVGFLSVLLSRSVRSPFVGFVSVMDKSWPKRNRQTDF